MTDLKSYPTGIFNGDEANCARLQGVAFHQLIQGSFGRVVFLFSSALLRGFAKKKSQKIRVYYGSGWVGGWVGPGLTQNFFLNSTQNSSKPVLIFWSSIQCEFGLYTHF